MGVQLFVTLNDGDSVRRLIESREEEEVPAEPRVFIGSRQTQRSAGALPFRQWTTPLRCVDEGLVTKG